MTSTHQSELETWSLFLQNEGVKDRNAISRSPRGQGRQGASQRPGISFICKKASRIYWIIHIVTLAPQEVMQSLAERASDDGNKTIYGEMQKCIEIVASDLLYVNQGIKVYSN